MKKYFAIVAMVAACTFGMTPSVMAQDEVADEAAATEQVVDTTEAVADSVEAEAPAPAVEEVAAPVEEEQGLHKTLKTKFIEGDAGFMSLVAIALVLGLAFCIERVIYLTLAQVNTRKFVDTVRSKVEAGKLQEAIDYFDQGIELAEAGSEFQVFLMVLKCTTLLALDDRQACLAACEALYRTKPLTRAQMGLFLSSPDDVLPDDLRQILLGLDADLLRRLLAHFEYLFVRRVPDAAARKNMFRGVLAQLARHRPLDGLPARVSAYL